jgi:hypothetical protein
VADEGFKLPGSSYGELAKIIRAYGDAPEEAALKDVADRAAIDQTVVSRNNGFLLSVGIVEGGNKKKLTSRGRVLAKALDFEMPDEIATAWRGIVDENDFLRKIVSAVRIRGGMELSALRSHIAYTAGASKKPASMAGAGSVIDALRVAGMLRDEDGKIVAAAPDSVPTTALPLESAVAESEAGVATTRVVTVPTATTGAVVAIQVQVRVDCKLDELDGLGAKLNALLDELAAGRVGTQAANE